MGVKSVRWLYSTYDEVQVDYSLPVVTMMAGGVAMISFHHRSSKAGVGAKE